MCLMETFKNRGTERSRNEETTTIDKKVVIDTEVASNCFRCQLCDQEIQTQQATGDPSIHGHHSLATDFLKTKAVSMQRLSIIQLEASD